MTLRFCDRVGSIELKLHLHIVGDFKGRHDLDKVRNGHEYQTMHRQFDRQPSFRGGVPPSEDQVIASRYGKRA